MNEIFRKRHACRRFKNREVSEGDLKVVLEAAESAPSAGGLKARKILVITDQKERDEIVKVTSAWNQKFLDQAPVLLVFIAVPDIAIARFGERALNLYALQDATIAVSFAWLQAVDLGLSACWIGAFDEVALKKILKLDGSSRPVAILPLGYSAE